MTATCSRAVHVGGIWTALVVAACGGEARNSSVARAPTTPPVNALDGGAGVNDDLTPSTTSVLISDAGELKGTRLVELQDAGVVGVRDGSKPRGHEPGRGADDIRALVLAHRDAARQCYERAHASHPELEGDLVMTWLISPTGAVSHADVDVSRSGIVEPSLVACVAEVIRQIEFAPSAGGFETKASYPFNFHPHRGRPAAPPE